MILQLHPAFAKALTLQLPWSRQIFQSEHIGLMSWLKTGDQWVELQFKITVYSPNHVTIPIKYTHKIFTQKIQCTWCTFRSKKSYELIFWTSRVPSLSLPAEGSKHPHHWGLSSEGKVSKKKTNNKCCMCHLFRKGVITCNHKGLSSKLCMIRLWLLPHNEIKCLCTLSTFYHLGPRRLDGENKVYVGGS